MAGIAVMACNQATGARAAAGRDWFPPLICCAVLAAYANTLSCPFVFDSVDNIVDNTSLRALAPITRAFWAPPDKGIAGRPLVNFTLALNYAVSGLQPWSYHLANTAIHALAALVFYAILLRLLALAGIAPGCLPARRRLAGCICLAWALHPLQTGAVTYVVQRCESLMGLFFLLTLLCALRGWEAPTSRSRLLWHALAIAACLLGAGCKEVIAVAPLMVFLGHWLLARRGQGVLGLLRESLLLYAGLAACLAGLAVLVISGRTAATTGAHGLRATLAYWGAQPAVVLHYLRLVVWPAGLCLDYGPLTLPAAWRVAAWVPVGGTLLAGALLLRRRNPWALPGAWFFAILAPTSLFPLPDAMFEHRLYLPSMAVVTALALGARSLLSRLVPGERCAVVLRAAATALVLCLGLLTVARNFTYASPVSIWSDTVRKRPGNARAVYNLGHALANAGVYDLALTYLRRSLELGRDDADLRNHLGLTLYRLGARREALFHFRRAVTYRPGYARAWHNLGMCLVDEGEPQAALAALKRARGLGLAVADLDYNQGRALLALGRLSPALVFLRRAARGDTRNPFFHAALGGALARAGRRDDALLHLRRALELDPGCESARAALRKLERCGAGTDAVPGR